MDTNMSTFWWKIILLQLLVTAMAYPTKVELDKKPRSINRKLITSLLNKLLEDEINDQHPIKETTDRAGQIKDIYDVPYIRPNYYLITEENTNTNKYDNLQPLITDYPNSRDVENVYETKIKKQTQNKTKLCYFKICNTKKSINIDRLRQIINNQ